MDKPPIVIQPPDHLRHFAKDGPGWKLAALCVMTAGKVAVAVAFVLLVLL